MLVKLIKCIAQPQRNQNIEVNIKVASNLRQFCRTANTKNMKIFYFTTTKSNYAQFQNFRGVFFRVNP